MIKGPEELETMKEAIDITRRGFLHALQALKPGMLEYEFEAELLYEFMKNGEKTPAFSAIVAGGNRATCLHYVENDKPLEEGTLLLLDFGARKDYYNSDITRTFPV
ncbi:Xaa-Pro aminopeptidase, partial [Candidatus Fermentibacteria bacterium]